MLQIDDNYFPAYEKIAETYVNKSMFDDAIEALQKASQSLTAPLQ